MNTNYNFILNNQYPAGAAFRALGINNFQQACNYVKDLPFLRASGRDDLTVVLTEKKVPVL